MSGPHFQRATLLLQQGRTELAETELRANLGEHPEHSPSHALLGLCLLERKRYDEAERETRRAIELGPDLAGAHYAHGKVMQGRNRLDEAERSYREAISIHPDDADYRGALAHLQAIRERWKEALSAAEEGLALDAEHVDCTNLRALALRQLDRVPEAEAVIEEALRRAPSNAVAHANQGWTLLHRGDHRGAAEHFREALRLDPDNAWARQGLIETLKARVPLYRPLLAYFLWMQRKPFQVRVAIAVGSYLVLRALGDLLHRRPETTPWALPLLLALLLFVWSTWLARPVSNQFLLLHPLGRHALAFGDKLEAAAVAVFLATGLGLGAWELATSRFWLPPILVLLPAIPATCVRLCPEGWPRGIMVGVAVGLALWGFGEAAMLEWGNRWATSRNQVDAVVRVMKATVDPYIYAILISQFLVIPLSRIAPRR